MQIEFQETGVQEFRSSGVRSSGVRSQESGVRSFVARKAVGYFEPNQTLCRE
ncbi:MAG: hypothetical protein JOZ21_10620 [Verrucomicrobia bacterium]|nr:hypothetical protein [Verrucomicrobiota bacterium]